MLAFDKPLLMFLAVPSVQFIVKIFVVSSERFLSFPVSILGNLPIDQCFIDEKLLVDVFSLAFIWTLSSITVDESPISRFFNVNSDR